MKKYIPEHTLSVAAAIAPLIIVAAAYWADSILGTDGVVGWGGIAVGLVSAVILLKTDSVVWKSRESDDFGISSDELEQIETEKSILNVKINDLRSRLDSAIKGKLLAEQKLHELEQSIKENTPLSVETDDIEESVDDISEIEIEDMNENKAEDEIIDEPVIEAVTEPVVIEKKVIETVTVEKKENFCGVEFKDYRNAVTSFAANSLRPAFMIRKELLSLEEKNCEKYIDAISTSLESMIYLSNLDKTDAPLKIEECDLNDVIRECTKKISTPISEKRIGTLRKGLEITVNTDRRWLTVAITHVLNNAAEHLEESNIAGNKIAIYGRKEDDCIFIDVKDSGRGCSEEELEHIFEPGYITLEEKQNSKTPCGMNLFIAKHAVEHLGGAITAESVVGKGTMIHIKLSDSQ